jgi:hypothetical protein
MAQPTNTFDTFDAIGNREDLSDEIYMLAVDETPFMSAVGSTTATATLHEWQTDTLGSASTSNAHIQGDDFSGDSQTATTRLTNRTQISKKQIVVSGTQEVVDKAGRDSEMAYQKAKELRKLKMDMEAILTGNQASVTGDATTAPKLRSLESWYETNDSRGTGGADGSTTEAATDATTGDLRDFTENLLKDVCQNIYTSGGNPDMIIAGPYNRRVLSGFAGNSTKMQDVSDKKLQTSVEVYVSDFGELKVMPSRHSRSRTVHVLDTDHWGVAYLRTARSEPVAKTGDAFKEQLIVEYTLESRNEAASGVIADLTSS